MILGSGLLQSSGWTPTWLIRDEFTDTRAAGSVNGTAATPGPGTRTVTDPDSKVAVAGGVLDLGDSGARRFAFGTFSRIAGLALLLKYISSAAEKRSSAGFGATLNPQKSSLYFNNNGYLVWDNDSLVISVPGQTSYNDQYAVVLRSAGAFHLWENGTAWTLLWVGSADTTATVYAAVATQNTATEANVDAFRVTSLPAPFDSDDGLATDTHNGSVAAGTTFVHEADFVLEYEVTTASGAETMVVFRRSDASNYWAIQINTSGVRLVKYEGGSGYSIALAGSNTDSRIVVVAEDTTIRVFQDNILLYTYTSATLNSSATSGFVRNPIIGAGAISDLKTWPRTLSGEAAAILDKASA